jgi:hypothetical protein
MEQDRRVFISWYLQSGLCMATNYITRVYNSLNVTAAEVWIATCCAYRRVWAGYITNIVS